MQDFVPKLKDHKYTTVFHAMSTSSKTKWVSIIFSKHVFFTFLDSSVDKDIWQVSAKILANCLLPFLPSHVSLDQVGFVPGRETSDKMTKALNLYHKMQTWQSGGVLPINGCWEVASHRLAWNYMAEVLCALGLQQHILTCIWALYSAPQARVKINGHLWDAFQNQNGIRHCRQGCPLSP